MSRLERNRALGMFEKLVAAAEKAKNAKDGKLNTTSEEIESLVCPSKFNSDDCVEIMCKREP